MKKENKIFMWAIFIVLLISLLPIVLDPIVSDQPLALKNGPFDYFWQLKERSSSIMIMVWFWFLVHFFGNALLFQLRRADNNLKKMQFSQYNIYLLLFNGSLILIHILHSVIFYDMFAQDFPSYTSQISVIIMLVILLLIQNSKRGFIFGIKLQNQKALNLLYKIHGPIFLLALTYTLWFHSFINTIGHIVGFFYMYLLFIQVSYTGTKIHYNGKWVAFLEAFVLFHGTSVAIFNQNSSLWSMFFFGFLFMFIASQMYSFTKNKTLIVTISIMYLILTITYYFSTSIININEIIRIPVIEYGLALIIYFILCSYLYIKSKSTK